MKPKEVIEQWVEAINHQVANEPVEGVNAIREMFKTEFSKADMTCIPENIFEDGEGDFRMEGSFRLKRLWIFSYN
jgi:hypothetical protein